MKQELESKTCVFSMCELILVHKNYNIIKLYFFIIVIRSLFSLISNWKLPTALVRLTCKLTGAKSALTFEKLLFRFSDKIFYGIQKFFKYETER